jgi:hypothetical protein
MCAHQNQLKLRLITYTRYGALCGCLTCGSSWLVRDINGVGPGELSGPSPRETKPTG